MLVALFRIDNAAADVADDYGADGDDVNGNVVDGGGDGSNNDIAVLFLCVARVPYQ